MSCPQQIVTSEFSETNTRICRLSLVPLIGSNEEIIMEVVHQMMQVKGIVRFSPFVFFGFDNQLELSAATYRLIVMKYKLLKTVLIDLLPGNESVHQFNFMTNKFAAIPETNIIQPLIEDVVRNVQGFAFRYAKVNGSKIVFVPYYNLARTFAGYVNATLESKQLSIRAESLQWFIENQIDVIVKRPTWKIALDVDIIPDHSFSGLCLLIPEQTIKPYVFYLDQPFQDNLWKAIFVAVAAHLLLSHTLKRFKAFKYSIPGKQINILLRLVRLSASFLQLILCEAYLTKLLAFMFNVKHEPHIRSMKEFNQSTIPVYILNHKLLRYIAQQYFPMERLAFGTKTELNSFPFERNSSHLLPCEMAKIVASMPWNWDPVDGVRKFYILNDRMRWFLSATTFTSLNPYYQRYKLVSDWTFEAGLWNHWVSKVEFGRGRLLQPSPDTLAFDDLISMWWIIFGWSSVAVMILLLEYVVYYFWKIIGHIGAVVFFATKPVYYWL
ncbi:hypothetical protein RP20_CCG000791 [Aedes albopictus]|nr:hypothetical protein RP20_CCG000791 [Aedes albopictus]